MIIEEYIWIGINSRNLNHFKNLGYEEVKVGIKLKVLSVHLCEKSNMKINAKCDNCDKETTIKMRTYTKSIKIYNYYSCKKCAIYKNIETNLKKYGVEHTFQSKEMIRKRMNNNLQKYGYTCIFQVYEIKEKIKKTNIEKYGFEKASQNYKVIEKMKNTRIQKGIQLPDNKLTDFIRYKRKVNSITNKNKKRLLLEWNGLDYYDNEYIKDNFILCGQDPNYPSIDHKISIWYGYKKEISPDIIGDISNLCFTKNYINSSKNIKNEDDFIL